MKNLSAPWGIRAGTLVVDPHTILRDVTLVIQQGKIRVLRTSKKRTDLKQVLDYRDCFIHPGLINAHVHLELTQTKITRPHAGNISSWIQELLTKQIRDNSKALRAAVNKGIHQCLASGTTTVGEIESHGMSGPLLLRSKLRAVVYREVLGLNPTDAKQRLQTATQSLQRRNTNRVKFGLSAHAPYSLSPELMQGIAKLARKQQLPLAMHLAESRAELQFLQKANGPLQSMLSEINKLPANWQPPRQSPLDYVANHGLLQKNMCFIHGNYLALIEIKKLAKQKCSVVFCPGSHAYFQYDRYPLSALLRAGVNVALGTDSLASNDSLNMYREMQIVAQKFPRLPAQQIFAMATQNGANALRLKSITGVLRPGKVLDCVVLAKAPRLVNSTAIYEYLTSACPKPIEVFVEGKRIKL